MHPRKLEHLRMCVNRLAAEGHGVALQHSLLSELT